MSSKKNKQRLIEMLEPRIMFDGAAVFTALELSEDLQDQQQVSLTTETIEQESRLFETSASRKEIVFIDSGVDDYQTILKKINPSFSTYLIDAQQDGFIQMQNILQKQNDVDAIHIIGHASAGQVVLGSAVLNAETLNAQSDNLRVIGSALSNEGDILFYGCNLAQDEKGKLLIQQIGNITQADIAASDDVTGQGGDWELEYKYGIVQTSNVRVAEYQSSLLQNGISSINSNVQENTGSDFRTGASSTFSSSKDYVVALERENVTNAGTLYFYKASQSGFDENENNYSTTTPSGSRTSFTVNSSNPVNSYLVYSERATSGSSVGSITFDGEIVGVYFQMGYIEAHSTLGQSGANYMSISDHGGGNRAYSTEGLNTSYGTNITSAPTASQDSFGVDTDSNTLYVKFSNADKHGDVIRVVTRAPQTNTAPVAQNDNAAVYEDATITVANSANNTWSNSWTPNTSTGDVLDTSHSSYRDTDADGDTLTVTSVRTGGTEGSGTGGSIFSGSSRTVTGTYGQLTLYSYGAYSYTANQNAADALDPNDYVFDYFNYTVSDGTATDTAVINVLIWGVNDTPVAINDTDSVNEDATITRTTSSTQELDHDDLDADGDDVSGSLAITAIRTGNTEGSGTGGSITSGSSRTVTGTYGTLTVYSTGAYSYSANTTAADNLNQGQSAYDYFNYTVSDGTASDIATLSILVYGLNNDNSAPSADNETVSVNEDATYSGTSSTLQLDYGDTDADGDTLSITSVRTGSTEGSGSQANISSGSYNTLTGTYGQITVYSDGRWTYTANQTQADYLDKGDSATEYFNYTVSDGTDTDYGTITINLTGINDEIVAVNDTDSVTEGNSINRSSTHANALDYDDTDLDANDTYSNHLITSIRTGNVEGSGTTGTLVSALTGTYYTVTGTYGTLGVYTHGGYFYNATTDAATALGAGDVVYDYFNYTVQDQSKSGTYDTDTATLTITVTGTNAAPVANNDTGSVNENATLTVSNGSSDVVEDNDTDADGDTLTITTVRTGGTEGSGTQVSAGNALTGTYGVLTLQANGSYTYTANTAAAEALDAGDVVTDVFNYTISDGNATDIATITITVTGQNDGITAVNDTDSVNEGATISRSAGSSYDIDSDDIDVDDSASPVITEIRTGSTEGSGTTGTLGQALTGTYGQLTLNSDGSYTYVANQDAANALDAGDSVVDYFNYQVRTQYSSGRMMASQFDRAVIAITVNGVNDAPVAANDTNSVSEGGTITVTDGSSDIIDDNDTDSDASASLVVSAIRLGNSEGSGTAGTVGSALTGTYGQLTLNANGSYTYVANTSAANALDAGDTVYDYFNYTLSDGTATDTATITITVTGVDDDITAVDDYDTVTEGYTRSRDAGTSYDIDSDDTDPDDSSSQTITAIRLGNTEGSGTAGTIGQALTSTYGQLTLNANGSYTYAANQDATNILDHGDYVYDYFNYTVTSGSQTDTAVIRITVYGVNDAPVAANDTNSVSEGGTVTVTDGSSDIIDDNDTDVDDSASLVVSAIRLGNSEGSGTAGTVGSALTGTYGQLTLNANGSYSYVANTSAANALDAGDTVYDYFNYTLSDGRATDTATITITVTGVDDDITAVDDYDSVSEGSSISRSAGSGYDIDSDDTDPDDSSSQSITAIRLGNTEGSGTAGTIGQALTGTYGQLTLNANGSYTYAANQDAANVLDSGDYVYDYFNYTVTSGSQTDTAVIRITVGGVNDAPVAANDTGSVNEGETLTVTDGSSDIIDDNDTDVDASSNLRVASVRTGGVEGSGTGGSISSGSSRTVTGTYGTLVLNSNGSYTYTADQTAANILDAGDTVTDVFNYTLTDGSATDIATITITVNGVDDDITAVNDSDVVNENATISRDADTGYDIDSDDTDPDASSSQSITAIRLGNTEGSGTAGTIGQALTGTYGQLTLNSNGSYTYAANQAAAEALDYGDYVWDYFNYTVTSGSQTDTAVISIRVAGVNDAPVAANDTGTVNEGETLTVTDGSSDIIEDNDTDADASAFLRVSSVRTGGVEGSGTAGSLGSALTGTYGQLTLNSNGSYTYVANQDAANVLDAGDSVTDVFNYTLYDGYTTDIATITITINGVDDDITAVNDTDAVNEGSTISRSAGSSYDIDSDDTDPDASSSQSITSIRLGSTEGSGTAGSLGQALTGTYGQLTLNADGSYSYVANQAAANALDAGDAVVDYFNYTVTSGSQTDTAVIAITVNGVNDAPVANNDTGAVNEDATLTVTDGSSDLVEDNDTDADASSSLTVTTFRIGGNEGSGTEANAGSSLTGTYGTLTINANGSYTYVADQDAADALAANATATDVFNYTISDGSATDIATLTITITGVDDAIVAVDDTGYINEDATLTVSDGGSAVSGTSSGSTSGDILTNDTDADDATPSTTVSSIRIGSTEGSGTAGSLGQALTGTYGQLTLNANGSYSYVANQSAADALDVGDTVTDIFNYTVSDGSTTDTGLITITIIGINDDPVAANDTGTVNEGETLTVSNGSSDIIDDNDTDADASASLTVSAVRLGGVEGSGDAGTIGSALTGTYGQLTLNANGSYTYVANQDAANVLDAGDTVTDVFNYTLSDGTATDIATITITINGVDDDITAVDDTDAVNEGATISRSAGSSYDIDSDDTDPDASSSQSITAIRKGGTEGIGVAGTLGSALTGTYGQLTLNADGSYSYVANQDAANALDAGATATDVFNYTVTSGSQTDTALITITVTGVDDDITAVDDTDAVNEDATISRSVGSSYDLDSDDNDPDTNSTSTITAIRKGGTEGSGDAGTIGSGLTGTYGTLTVNANGSYTYVADQAAADALDTGDTVTDVFNYTVTSGSQTDTAVLTITVTGINDAPVAANDTGSVNEGATLTVSNGSSDIIDDNDTDADASSSLSVSAIRTGGTEGSGTAGSIGAALTGTYGQITVNADGSYSYVANQDAANELDAGDTVTDVFNYTLSDGTATDIATITITITGVNDAPSGVNDTGYINEDATLTVADGGSAVAGTASGSNSGDVLANDTDPDASPTLTLTGTYSHTGGTDANGSSNSSTSNSASLGSGVLGTYGTLTLAADGSYTYAATTAAADALGNGDRVTDVFTYTVTDENSATSTATITITVIGQPEALEAVDDTDAINAGETITVSDGDDEDVMIDDTSTAGGTTLIYGADTGSASGSTNNNYALKLASDFSANGTAFQIDTADANHYAVDSYDGGYVVVYQDSSSKEIRFKRYDASGNAIGSETTVESSNHLIASDYTGLFYGSYDVAGLEGGGFVVVYSDQVYSNNAFSGQLKYKRYDNSGNLLSGSAGSGTINGNSSQYNMVDVEGLSNGGFVTAYGKKYTSNNYYGNYTYINFRDSNSNLVRQNVVTYRVHSIDLIALESGGAGIFYTYGSSYNVSSGKEYLYYREYPNNSGTGTLTTQLVYNGFSSDSSSTNSYSQDALELTNGNIVLTYAKYNSGSYERSFKIYNPGTNSLGSAVQLTGSSFHADIARDGDGFVIVSSDSSGSSGTTVIAEKFNADGSANGSQFNIASSLVGLVDPQIVDSGVASLNVSAIRTGQESGSGTSGSVGSALTGTYGTLTIAADGSYTYAATTTAATNLASGTTAYDYFTYTVSDGTNTDTAQLSILVTGTAVGDPTAVNDTDAVNAGSTITVSDGDSEDVLTDDTDPNSLAMTVTAVRLLDENRSGTSGTVGQALTGTYGQLTLNANGSYTYNANQAAATALPADATVTDVFTYTVTNSGGGADLATLTITITGINDAPVAVDDTDAVNEDATIARGDASSYDIESDDTDADTGASLTVDSIRTGSSEGSGTAGTLGSALTGTYGTLTMADDGSYTYVADQAAADALDAGDTVTDVFNYTISDGTATDTALLTITVTGVNDDPVATNDTGAVNEGETLTVSNGSGDIVENNDTDADDSSSLTVTSIRTGSTEGSGTAGTLGVALTGTYGQITVNANGSYTYVANQDAANALDAGATATDVFNYTISDGTASDTATITITITGVDDDITAVDDTDAVNEDATITRSADTSYDIDSDDTDPDTNSSSTITAIRKGGSEGSGDAGTIGSGLTGTYGTLTMNADGSYSYVADQAAADALDAGDTATDVFNYTVTSGSQTDTALLTITVTGINDAPVAANDTGSVDEDATLTVANGSGDLVENNDTDLDPDAVLTITEIRTGSTEGSGTSGTVGSSLTGTYGTITVNSDGSYTYVADQDAADALDAGDTVTDTFNYTLSDGTATDMATITITITGVDDDITAVDDTDAVDEDGSISRSAGTSYDLDSDDSDPDEDDTTSTSTITAIRTGSTEGSGTAGSIGSGLTGTYGTLTVNSDGSYSYVADQSAADDLDLNDTAIDYFNYTVTSGSQTDIAVLAITVTGINDAPVAANDTGSVDEDATLTVSNGSGDLVENNDTDPDDSASLVISAIRVGGTEGSGTAGTIGSGLTGTYGTITVNANGSYTYVADQAAADALDAGDTVTDVFNYTLSDGTVTDTATITITITGVDDDITAVNDTDAVNEDATISRSVGDSQELDGDDVDLDDSSTSTITGIRLGNTEDSGTAGTIGSALTGTYGTLTVNANGSYTYVADQTAADALDDGDTAIDYFNYTVTSGSQTDTAVLAITVTGINDAPVAANDTGSVNEGETLTVSNGSSDIVEDNDSDADDSSTLTVTAIRIGGSEGSGTAGTVGSALTGTYGTLTLNANGSYTYVADQDAANILDAGDSVTDVFNYTVSDGTDTDTATLTITVAGVDDDITAVNDTDAVNEDATISRSVGDSQELDSDDTDPDDSSTSTITGIRIGSTEDSGVAGTIGSALTGTYGTLTVNANGSYTYVADQDAADALDLGDTAIDYFNYTVTSGSQTDTAVLAITVTGLNDDPVAANDTGTVNEGETLTVSNGSGDIVEDNDTDADDSSTLTVTAIRIGSSEGSGTAGSVGSALTGTYGQLTLNANGSYTYVANQDAADALDAGDTVTDVFNYTVSDGTATDMATITITINGVDDDITAVDDTDAVNEDATISRSVGDSQELDSDDTDPDDSSTSTITGIRLGSTEDSGTAGSIGSALTGTYGTLTVNANGSYTYVADQTAADALDAGDTAIDYFNYTVTSGSQTDTAVLAITVTGINDAPVASNDTGTVNEGETLTVSDGSSDVVEDNDSDADDSSTLTVTAVRVGSTEGSGTAGTVGSALTGTYGQLTLNANGSYTYVANQDAADALDAGDTVTDVFNYTISSGTDTDTATITITVNGVDDDITAVDDTDVVNENATISRSVGDSQELDSDDTDPDDSSSSTITGIRLGNTEDSGVAGTIGSALTGTYGTLTVNANGSYTYAADQTAADALDAGDTAIDYFNYTVTSGSQTDTAVLAITVTGLNDAPVAANDTGTVNEGETLTVSNGSSDVVEDNDTDADDSAALNVTEVRLGSSEGSGTAGSVGSALTGTYGQLTLNANGSYSYVANQDAADALDAGDTVTDVFNYTVSDGTDTDMATITITVNGVDDDITAVDDTDAVDENASISRSVDTSYDIDSDDTDPDDSSSSTITGIRIGSTEDSGVPGTIGSGLAGTYGTLTLNANGSYSYTADQSGADALDAGDTAIDYFNYTVTSGSQTDTAVIAITVTGINDAPVAVDDTDEVLATQTITRSAGSSYDIDSDDTDLDDSSSLTITAIRLGSTEGSGDAGTVGSALVGTYGTLTVNADGSYSYAADQDAATSLSEGSSVTDIFNYTVSDGTATDTGLITITVSASNAPPVAVNDTGSVNENATLTVADGSGDVVEDNDTDANSGDTLTITHVRTGSTEGSGTLGTLGSGLTGTYGTLTLNANGSYTYVADQDAADALDAGDTVTDVFNYTVSDGSATDMATITITVNGINDAPVAVDDTDAVNEDATITRSVGDSQELDSDDTDADDSSSLTITAIRIGGTEGSGTAGTIGSGLVGTYGTLTVNADGSYSYVADQAAADALDDGDTVTDVFNYTVSDGTDTDTATLTITVTGVDDEITAVNDTDTVVEGASIARIVDSEYDIDSDDIDLDESSSSRITAIRLGSSEGSGDAGTLGSALTGTYGQLTMRANGSYFYIADQTAANALAAGETATDVFNYTVTSGSQTDTALLTITITGENDAVVAVDDTDAVDEDATITRAVGDSQELDGDDTDDDTNDTTTIVGIATGSGDSTVDGTVGSPLIGTYGTLTVNADGSYTYSADQDATDELPAGAVVTDVFTYTVSDGTATDTATLTITVTSSDPKNNPVAVDNRETLTAGETIEKATASVGVIANDTDDGQDALTVGETSISAIRTGRELGSGDTGTVGTALIGTYGTLTINSDGSYTYTADQAAAERLVPNQTRSDVFTYTLSDGTDTDEAELHFRVKGKNDPPTSTDMATVRVMERQRISLKPGTFFSDPDNPNTTYGTLKYFVSDLPEGLTVNENNGNIVGRITTEGTYTFVITAIDGGGLTTQETITIIVGKPIFKEREKVKLPKIKITPKTINELVQAETVIFNEFEALSSANSFEARVGTTLQPIVKDLSFNGGMKVVDVAVDDTKAFGGDNDGTIVGFAVGDDYRSNVKQYTGVLDNGQALPDWVKIDRTTGQTLVQFPEGQESIDIRLVAVDKDNTTRQINLTLNKEKVENDPTLRRDLNEFVDRSASLKTEVTVNNQGQVELLATENSQVDQSRSANLNAPTNLSAPQTEPNSFDNSFTNTNSIPSGTLKLAEIEKVNELVRVKITDDNRDNVRQYSAGFANGTPLPQWIQVNPTTGEVQATPPAGIETISFKIFAEDENGDIRSIDVDLDFTEENEDLSFNIKENESSNVVKFASLNDQIQIQSDDYDEYGERLVKASS